MLNLSLKTRQKKLCSRHARVVNDTENRYACGGQNERLQGMLLTYNGINIVETQK
ncbi:MAG: hypothetical protein ACFNVO_05720 [Prevotella sp.]